MKKFIVAFDGLSFRESTMTYAIYLATQCNAHLVGVFLEDFVRRSYGIKELVGYAGADLDNHMNELEERDEETRKGSIDLFRQACAEAKLPHSVHRDRDVAFQELLHESIYADALIISAGESLTRYEEKAPTDFIQNLLDSVQCPVVLTPPTYQPLDKIILMYNGEPSSVHAVRTFSYLFENLKHFETEVLTVKEEKENLVNPDGRLIKEFIKQHYPNADSIVLTGNPEDVILAHLQVQKKNPFVVLGAYQRSNFSRLFKPSMADRILRRLELPLFIAHNKS